MDQLLNAYSEGKLMEHLLSEQVSSEQRLSSKASYYSKQPDLQSMGGMSQVIFH